MTTMGFPHHLIELFRSLYQQQQAAVKTSAGITEWFEIEQGVRQGCILSPYFFNVFSEMIVREALEGFEGSIKIGGRMVTDLRYADDTALLAGSREGLQRLTDRVNRAGARVGLRFNVRKTKIMVVSKKAGPIWPVEVNGEKVELVKSFQYLGSLFNEQYDDSAEIRRRIAIAKKAVIAVTAIWKDKSIRIATKLRLLRPLVFPIATYGSKTWVSKKADRKRIESFEMWFLRKTMRVSWIERRTNDWMLKETCIKNKDRLLVKVDQAKLRYFGHVVRGNSLEKAILEGMVFRQRSQ